MLRIRLTRIGKKKKPFYRVVVAPSQAPRSGRFVEIVGHYNPITDPAQIHFNEERVLYWLKTGAQPTDSVERLLKITGILDKVKQAEQATAETNAEN